MKKKIRKAIEVVNTLIFKAEALGDPDTPRQKNKSLMIQLEKYKIEEIKRNREIEEMKSTIEALRNEVLELGDKLDEVEQERERENGKRRLEKSKERRKKEGESNKGSRIEATKNSSSPTSDKIEDINKQIKELVKKRIGLRMESNAEGSETGSDLQRTREDPLPQRIPKTRPRIKSNIQQVPPRSDEKKMGDRNKVTGQNKTLEEEKKDEWTEIRRGNKGRAKQLKLDSIFSTPRPKGKPGRSWQNLERRS
ncbi:hypothetical protein RF55_7125 [Lasius niger]|uniref:Uncharacterized protein n=1 Tax=Lasius niger TaxID=67767 RepID=A0A0J7KR24_LASNI|nr:hypothetical protein RF55_7125 [Lasius niger]